MGPILFRIECVNKVCVVSNDDWNILDFYLTEDGFEPDIKPSVNIIYWSQ